MSEVDEEKGSGGLDLQRYLNLVQRRHMQFLIPFFMGWLLVWSASWILPVRYKSGTLILVDQPTMPKDYVAPNVNDDLQQRMQSIKQQVLSRSRLLLIIDKFHLFSGERRQLAPDEKVALMSKSIDVELVQDPYREQIYGFRISYSAHDPRIAQKVATELTNTFINENNKVHQQLSEDTTQFLEGQMEIARAHLAEQESKVRVFEAAHEGELPSQQLTNLQILGSLQAQLTSEQDSLNTAKQQRSYLQTLVDQSRPVVRAATHSIDGTPTGLAAIDQQLDQLNSKLAELKSRYTDNYPDVQGVKDQIARTQKARDALAAQLKAQAQTSKPADQAAETDDPTASTQYLQLKGQLQSNQIEIANREQSIAALKTKINDIQAQLKGEPATEQQLTDLTRGYEQSKQDYDELVKRHNESQMATSMEQMQQGERFTMLDPAVVPLKPDFPNRLKFCGMGLGAGVGLGLAVLLAFEYVDGRLHTEKQIKALLSMVILAELPEVLSSSDELAIKRKMVLGWSTAAVVIAIILAGSAFSYLRG